jgi:transcriptional regulator with XRE-family HTH domain
MDRLAELREKRVLTLRELSGMSGVSPDTINQIELGRRRPRPSTLRKLARALDVDTKDFFEPEEMTATPKADAPLSFSRWLLERCGHSYLTLSEEELRQRFDDLEGFKDAANKKRDLFTAVQAEYIATIRTRRLPPEERVLVRGHHLEAVGKWLLAQTLSGQAEGITEAFEQSVKEAIEAVVDETA